MRPRVLILPISAAVIFGLVLWRQHRELQPGHIASIPASGRQLAPRFALYDQHSQLVKFERYLGRTRLLVLFTGRSRIADHPLIHKLVDLHAAIEDAGVQVVIVTVSTPYAVRQAEEQLGTPFPFPVLADFDEFSPAPTHRQWGLTGDDPADTREGLFLIDRDGAVAWTGAAPQPVADANRAIETIASGA